MQSPSRGDWGEILEITGGIPTSAILVCGRALWVVLVDLATFKIEMKKEFFLFFRHFHA